MKMDNGSAVCSGVLSLRRQNNKRGLRHFRVPTGSANATRKKFLREPLVLETTHVASS